ncbi:MAG: SLC13 family permease [Planctomycetota bacterium]
MAWEAWLVLFAVVAVLWALLRNWGPADAVLVVIVSVLALVGELTGSARLPSFVAMVGKMGDSGLISVGVLFVVVAGLVQTGAMSLVTKPLLGSPRTERSAQIRIMTPVALLSCFLNNTPVVAMFMPVVDDICKRTRISPSSLYLPMAYAATFGGMCTLIGTSTNLLVNNAYRQASGGAGMRMFVLFWVAFPGTLAAIMLTVLGGRWLLPKRQPAIQLDDDPRQYTTEMVVSESGSLVGKTVEEAGLRSLPGLYLLEIERRGEVLAAVTRRQRLEASDRLVFVGLLESVVDLLKIRGLERSREGAFTLDAPPARRRLIEVVVSDRCPLVGTTIREGKFRTTYSAAVVALARGGTRIEGKIGDIELRAGDTLLLETDEDFVTRQRNSNHFVLISGVENYQPIRHDRAWVALTILVAMVAVVSFNGLSLLAAALVAGCLMVALQCCTLNQARQAIDWPLLVTIAAALGIGEAISTSGLAATIAGNCIQLVGGQPWLVLVVVYLLTMVFTELITNNAAAILVFPIAWQSAADLGVSPLPFVITVCIAASVGFATPFGYQTNLMVYGPGGYRFSDYFRLGVPLDLIFFVVTVLLAPVVFPF